MAHQIKISRYEAQLLARKGIVARVSDTEDGYFHYYVNETPAVLDIICPPADVFEDSAY